MIERRTASAKQWHISFKNLKVAGEFKKEKQEEEKKDEKKGEGRRGKEDCRQRRSSASEGHLT